MALGHWHGYLWTGPGKDLKDESLRRPSAPGTPATQEFLRSSLPPMRLGHYLLRRSAASADLTWTDVDEAIDWMAATYKSHPPMEGDVGFPAVNGAPPPLAGDVGLDARRATSRDGLINGVDAYWQYYTNPNGGIVAYAAICCPHTHLPDIPCPLPPRP
ncbi:hypothetical protein [Actinoplanes sp. NPDC051494]|uniref:hypothetical protein n=1 Tax=Actinoplanes sp. NPDC051494 TaxID=3363907 RepID=UPI0037B7DB31